MKKFLRLINLPILIVGILISLLAAYFNYNNRVETEQYKAMMIAGTAMNSFKFTMEDYLDLSDSLALVVDEADGEVSSIESLAQTMYDAKEMEYAQIYRFDGDEESVTTYPANTDTLYVIDLAAAAEAGETIVSDPFSISEDTYGFAVVTPLYGDDFDKANTFWGVGVFVLAMDDVVDASNLSVMDQLNYNYRLMVHDAEGSGDPQLLLESGDVDDDLISLSVQVGDQMYDMEMSAKGAWVSWTSVLFVFLFLFALSFILAITRGYASSFKKMNDQLQNVNEKLTVAATRDPLTGIYNRRGGQQKMEEAIAANRSREAILIEFDIDKFKDINDTYGHDAGDLALKQIAYDMKAEFGTDKIYIRNGGDEFLIFIADPDASFEEKMADFANGQHYFTYENETITFTISCGYTSYPDQAKKIRDLIKCADEALYQVKLGGRRGYKKYEGSIMTE